MTPLKPKSAILPPRLSMDEYVDFIEASLRDTPPEQVARQKALEKRGIARFEISACTETPAHKTAHPG